MNKAKTNPQTCMIIGDPVANSLSPRMHTAGYKSLGIEDEFAFVALRVEAQNLHSAVKGIRALGPRGVCVTMPHKESIIPMLDDLDSAAKSIGAVNTVIINDGKLTGANTDWIGVIGPLSKVTPIKGKKVALIGAGGAARAACYGLTKEGADVTVFNRNEEKAKKLAQNFNCRSGVLQKIDDSFHIFINATPLGMKGSEQRSPVPDKILNKDHTVFDMVYRPSETPLLIAAVKARAKVIYGIEMLLHQGAKQFALFTGHEAPIEAMRNAIEE